MSQELRTRRLRLRRWCDADRAPFAEINADPEVGRWLSGTLDRTASDAFVDRIEAGWERDGFGLFAVEVVDGPPLVGFVGLLRPNFDAHFTPAVEIGWRLSPAVWRRGYATEGAEAVVRFAFDDVGLGEVVSFTAVGNSASRRVMERIGLRHDPADDFDHPRLAEDHPLRRHVLYRLAAAEWRAARR